MEIYKRYRPKTLDEVIGQQETVTVLKDFLQKQNLPHALLLSGASGVGKTTIARILRRELKCSKTDYVEINAAESRGIDTIRDIANRVHLSPFLGKVRIWTIDEAAKLTNDAQNAMLKLLEDTPNHVYFFLCTTDPQKLIPTIHTRCTHFKLGSLSEDQLDGLLVSICKREFGDKWPKQHVILQKIAEFSDGSARKALVKLGQIVMLPTLEEQLEAVQKQEVARQAIDLARALMNPKSKWPTIAEIVKNLDEEPEMIRRLVLVYCSSVILGGGGLADKAAMVLSRFEPNWYDSGKPGLVLACWDCFSKH